jgi:hypothetical protein
MNDLEGYIIHGSGWTPVQERSAGPSLIYELPTNLLNGHASFGGSLQSLDPFSDPVGISLAHYSSEYFSQQVFTLYGVNMQQYTK